MEASDNGSEATVSEAVKVLDLQILGKPFQIFQFAEASEPILGFCETYLQRISVMKGLPTETEQETFLRSNPCSRRTTEPRHDREPSVCLGLWPLCSL